MRTLADLSKSKVSGSSLRLWASMANSACSNLTYTSKSVTVVLSATRIWQQAQRVQTLTTMPAVQPWVVLNYKQRSPRHPLSNPSTCSCWLTRLVQGLQRRRNRLTTLHSSRAHLWRNREPSLKPRARGPTSVPPLHRLTCTAIMVTVASARITRSKISARITSKRVNLRSVISKSYRLLGLQLIKTNQIDLRCHLLTSALHSSRTLLTTLSSPVAQPSMPTSQSARTCSHLCLDSLYRPSISTLPAIRLADHLPELSPFSLGQMKMWIASWQLMQASLD